MENLPQNTPQQDDLLEQLLAGAAERAAQKEMEQLAQKGTVTKAEFSTALGEFENRLVGRINEALAQKAASEAAQRETQKAEPETETETVQKGGSTGQQSNPTGRRSTVQGSSDPRSDNPVKYLLQKAGRGEELDATDKAVVWELTKRGFAQGMSMEDPDGRDFADEYLQ